VKGFPERGMTEMEWWGCPDPRAMVEFLSERLSERKLRLFAVACCRRIWRLIANEHSRRAVEVAEFYAEGLADETTLEAAQDRARTVAKCDGWSLGEVFVADRFAAAAAAQVAHPSARRSVGCCFDAAEAVGAECFGDHCLLLFGTANAAWGDASLAGRAANAARDAERKAQCDALRDIVGNPFATAVLNPLWLAWNDRIIPALAEEIYADQAYDHLPILGDALEDAGCTDQALLYHLRGPGPHVRGCWPLDLILSKDR
jgi:hypothetical protein